ncbi:hypothetical protein GF327_04400 [Candidatus Woesearchaeota archaeon]|nr:hypothetical protein [Candidatus Woesearchaeota archaeon]
MNQLDQRVYKALKFFADNTRAKTITVMEDDEAEYKKTVPEDVSVYLSEQNYIDAHGSSRYIITYEGIKELRVLEEVKNRDRTLYIAIAALIISLYTLASTQGWI